MNAEVIARDPPATVVDLRSQSFMQDPFPTLSRLRELGPVAKVRLPLLGKVWMATTYDAVNDLLRNHQRFVQNPAAAGNRWMSGLLRWLPPSLRPITTNLILRDEPDHRRLRSLVEQAFLRQSVEALRPRLESLAEQALDRLEATGRAASGVDLIAHFARAFPLTVICELLGLPPEDRPKFIRWAARFSTASTMMGILFGMTGLAKTMSYLRREIRRQTRQPRGGLLAALIEAEEAGDRLNEDELLAMVFLLLVAGHHTTTYQIAGSVLILLDHPQQLAELRSDWGVADRAVQELLRYYSFAQMSKPRYPREEMEFYGQKIRRGQMVLASLAAANSDPARFDDPQRLNLHRDPHGHVAFGSGIHFCLGAKLASVETEIALRRLFTRFPKLRLAVPREQIRYATRVGSRSLLSLPLAW
jgi:cytochrome P450